MKLIIKALFVVLLIGISGLFILKRPDGQPWLRAEEFVPDLSVLKSKADRTIKALMEKTEQLSEESRGSVQKTQVYKWKRADGSWTYSDKPPPDSGQMDVEVMLLDSNTNVIPAMKLPTETQKTTPPAVGPKEHKVPLPLTASPQEIKKLVDDASQLQPLIDQREESLRQY